MRINEHQATCAHCGMPYGYAPAFEPEWMRDYCGPICWRCATDGDKCWRHANHDNEEAR